MLVEKPKWSAGPLGYRDTDRYSYFAISCLVSDTPQLGVWDNFTYRTGYKDVGARNPWRCWCGIDIAF